MKSNILFKILSSLPVILIVLYYLPFLGICLILFRFFMNKNKKYSTAISITVVGLAILLPKLIYSSLEIFKINMNIPYLNNIINSNFYNIELINYSKFIISTGVILLVISYVLKQIFDKISNKLNDRIHNYITTTQKQNAEIARKNDMEIKIKQEKAKQTSYVECPNCGSDNLLSEKFGTCKYCRSTIENKHYKV